MKLTVSGYNEYEFLTKDNEFNSFGGNGKNVSPALSWNGTPEDAKSFAITMYDPDAPTGSGFWHWIAYDIPRTIGSLPAGAGMHDQTTTGIMKQAMSDFGVQGYGGCCPPEGDVPHRYTFTLHALDCETLEITPDTPNAVIRFLIHMHSIQKANVTLLYKR